MPELPEVETVRRSIAAFIVNAPIIAVSVSHHKLRYPIPTNLHELLCGKCCIKVERRAKYLLLHLSQDPSEAKTIKETRDTQNTHSKCDEQNAQDSGAHDEKNSGTLIIHLGMSGRLLLLPQSAPTIKHEHVTITFADGNTLRFVDPRRFGALLWIAGNATAEQQHPALQNLGVEPLSSAFTAHHLYKLCQQPRRHISIKQLIMDNKTVVGVGNIYASEVLFLSGIKPQRKAATLSLQDCTRLVAAIKKILQHAIELGGTTIRDFVSGDGADGKFVQQLKVYGRAGMPCCKCKTALKTMRLGQRSTVYCPRCQK